jgi:hypothetical protein
MRVSLHLMNRAIQVMRAEAKSAQESSDLHDKRRKPN